MELGCFVDSYFVKNFAAQGAAKIVYYFMMQFGDSIQVTLEAELAAIFGALTEHFGVESALRFDQRRGVATTV